MTATQQSGLVAASLCCSVALVACRDIDGFSTASGGHYEGTIVGANFVRAGLEATVSMCLLLDTEHFQDTPGSISTSDALFRAEPLRSIPQLWDDPLSTFNFGEGRIKNLLYVARGRAVAGSPLGDVIVVISLLVSGSIEVRLLRGAPFLPVDGGDAPYGPSNLFGVFTLDRYPGACSF